MRENTKCQKRGCQNEPEEYWQFTLGWMIADDKWYCKDCFDELESKRKTIEECINER